MAVATSTQPKAKFLQATPQSLARRRRDRLFGMVCFSAIILSMLALVTLLGKVTLDGISTLNTAFLQGPLSRNPDRAGIRIPLLGSLWIIAVTAAAAVPIGVFAAIYLQEFRTKRNRLIELIQINIANLAGVPSIVFGMLGLALFVTWFQMGRSVLAAGLTMALLILPLIIIVSQEALKAVPQAYRDASLALGATRWQTIWTIVLPNALPSILTGIILSISRAIGETAPLLLIGAAAFITQPPSSLNDRFAALPLTIYNWSKEADPRWADIAASGIIVLIATLLVLNSIAIIIRARTQRGH